MSKAPNFKQELTAVFGMPVAENPTQVMVEAAYRHHGLAWRYLTIEVAPADLEAAVRGARAMGFAGFNCTIPHKVTVVKYLDSLGESARLMGAVNCVVRRGSQLVGENTDGKGFLSSLQGAHRPERPKDRDVRGGWRGAGHWRGARPGRGGAHHHRKPERGARQGACGAPHSEGRARGGSVCPLEGPVCHPSAETDVVINATSIGLYPDVEAELEIDFATLGAKMIVADVIPNPPLTRLIRVAKERGCKAIDGLGMLVNQGVIGVKHWTGVDADPRVMRAALEEVFGK